MTDITKSYYKSLHNRMLVEIKGYGLKNENSKR